MTMTRRKAFTLIELLVAVGIIAVLIGLVTFALRSASNQSRTNATRVAMENLKSMLGEMDLATKYQTQPGLIYQYPDPPGGAWMTPVAATPMFWTHASDTTNTAVVTPAPGRVTEDSRGGALYPARTDCGAVYNTIAAMTELVRLPINKAALDRMPPSELLRIVPVLAGGPANPAPIVIDSWHNPIIFVPGQTGLRLGELYNATRRYVVGDYVVNAGGVSYRCIQPTSGNAPPNVAFWEVHTAIFAPNYRPFFASAGPDGDFSKGDDNIYSFEQ